MKQLQYFCALHEHAHFGRAADACCVSQSTLSAAITQLEETLEAELLEREHKVFIFTPLGETVAKEARAILTHCLELTEFARCNNKPLQGSLRLGCIPTIAPFILSKLMAKIRHRYPDLNLLVKEETTDNTLRALQEGHLDLVILALPYQTTEFHTEVIARDPFKLVLHRDWLNKGFKKEIKYWPDESLFLLDKEHCLSEQVLEACAIKTSQKINPFYATSLHTLVQMINNKQGVSFIPEMAINSGILAKTDLVQLPPRDKKAYREIGLAWRKTSMQQTSYRLICELVAETI